MVHRLLEHGPSGFDNIQEAVDGISSMVRSDSLEDLEENDLVDREIISENPFRAQYSLIADSESLQPIIYPMRDWGEQYMAEPDEDPTEP